MSLPSLGDPRPRFLVLSLLLVLGCSPAPDPPEPAASSTPEASSPADRDPDRLASGSVHGLRFEVEDAQLVNGILTLRQGEDFFADRQVMLFLFADEGQVPAERSWRLRAGEPKTGGSGAPHLHTSSRSPGADLPHTEMHVGGVDLVLELDAEKPWSDDGPRRVPGWIELSIPEEKTEVIGNFEAVVGGFVLDDGEPDRMLDSPRLVCFLGARRLEQELGDSEIEDRYGKVVHSEPAWGVCDLRAETASGSVHFERVVTVEADDGWTIHERLDPFDIRSGSPFGEPDPTDAWSATPPQIAEWFETNVEGLDAGATGLFDFRVEGLSTNRLIRLGQATGMARTSWEGEPIERRFLLRLDEAGFWRVDRPLEAGEEVDFEAGRIVRSD